MRKTLVSAFRHVCDNTRSQQPWRSTSASPGLYFHPLCQPCKRLQPGETAEIAAAREVEEETGIKIKSLRYAGTYWFGKKQMLMIGFIADAGDDAHIAISSEVDSAGWYPAARAVAMVHPAGSVSHTLCDIYLGSITG